MLRKRNLVVASTRHHHSRLLKYYPRPPCAPSFVKSRIFRPLQTHFLLFQQVFFVLLCIHPGTPRVPPRVNPAGATNPTKSSTIGGEQITSNNFFSCLQQLTWLPPRKQEQIHSDMTEDMSPPFSKLTASCVVICKTKWFPGNTEPKITFKCSFSSL